MPVSQHEIEVSDQASEPEGGGYSQGSWVARQHLAMGYEGPFAYFLAGEYAGRRLKDPDARVAFFVAYRDVISHGSLRA